MRGIRSLRLWLIVSLATAMSLGLGGYALAGEHDGVNTVGTWAVGDVPGNPLPTAVAMAQGWNAGFAGTSFSIRDFYYNQSAKERHLRDPQFSINGHPGNDQYSFDENDIGMFIDHGQPGQLDFSTNVDANILLTDNVRWGNYELKWVYIFACEWMKDGGDPTLWEKMKMNMAGLHVMSGFVDHAWLMSDGYNQGLAFVNALKLGLTFENAFEASNYFNQPSGTRLKTRWANSPNCQSDHLPGFGSYQTGTPQPYPTGAVSEYVYTC
jgi:Family of unknown function (DUF6345)